MAFSPEEQKRLTVEPGTVIGRPAITATLRPTLKPCGPSGKPVPMTTSSISAGSSFGTFRNTSLMQWAAMSSGRVRLNEPRNDFAIPVRELATITASRMTFSFGLDCRYSFRSPFVLQATVVRTQGRAPLHFDRQLRYRIGCKSPDIRSVILGHAPPRHVGVRNLAVMCGERTRPPDRRPTAVRP